MIANTAIVSDRFGDQPNHVQHISQKPLILVIEDDPDNLLLLYHFLDLNHFKVLLASDPLTGLQLATHHSPDLILLDIMLPKMSGYELLHRIRKNLKLASIPVIAVTGMYRENDKQKILQAGFTDYLCKPYLLNRLQEMIQCQLAELMPKVAFS